MQHKRRGASGKMVLVVLAVVLAGGLISLMTMDVPAPQKPVEQVLDAKTFLESKPAQ